MTLTTTRYKCAGSVNCNYNLLYMDTLYVSFTINVLPSKQSQIKSDGKEKRLTNFYA